MDRKEIIKLNKKIERQSEEIVEKMKDYNGTARLYNIEPGAERRTVYSRQKHMAPYQSNSHSSNSGFSNGLGVSNAPHSQLTLEPGAISSVSLSPSSSVPKPSDKFNSTSKINQPGSTLLPGQSLANGTSVSRRRIRPDDELLRATEPEEQIYYRLQDLR